MNTRKHWLSHFFAFFFVLCMTLGLTAYADEDMKVHFLNVGQADSTLITCGEHAMLIDAGNNDDAEPIMRSVHIHMRIISALWTLFWKLFPLIR